MVKLCNSRTFLAAIPKYFIFMVTKKKVVTLSANTSWYLYNFRKSTIDRFIKDGYEVFCIAPKDAHTKKLKDLGCNWFDLKMNNQGHNPFKDLVIIFRLFYIYTKLKPVVAFHFTVKNNIYGTWASFFSNTPAVNNISGLGTAFIKKGFLSFIVKILYRLSQPMAKRVYSQNIEDFNLLANKKLISRKKLFLLPGSGVDINKFKPNFNSKKVNTFRFLFVGRILADKGIYELIHAIENINKNEIQCQLWICGFKNSKNISAINDDQIKNWQNIPGVTWIEPNDEIEKIMKDVNCIVLPSYREGMPRSLLEAGAIGLPSITTDVPGCRNIIQDNINGFICEARNSKSLELAMLRMLNTPNEDIIRMGKAARNIVENRFDEKIVIDAYADVLSSFADN